MKQIIKRTTVKSEEQSKKNKSNTENPEQNPYQDQMPNNSIKEIKPKQTKVFCFVLIARGEM